jgi:hypothetical protein
MNIQSVPLSQTYAKVPLYCWAVLWHPSKGEVIQMQIHTLSCDSFYGISLDPFAPGEQLEASIEIPAQGYHSSGPLKLHCCATVIRIELRGAQAGYGLTCRITDYSFVC